MNRIQVNALLKVASAQSNLRKEAVGFIGRAVGNAVGAAGKVVGRVAAAGVHAAAKGVGGAAKSFGKSAVVEPIAQWAKKNPQAVADLASKAKTAGKAAGYTAAVLGAAAAVGGGAYAIQKAKENNVGYGSRPQPKYY